MSTTEAETYNPAIVKGDTFDTRRISWVTTGRDVTALVAAIEDHHVVVFDLETTGLDEHAVTHGQTNGGVAARIVLASFTLPDRGEDGAVLGEPTTWVVPLSHPDSPFLGTWRLVYRRLAAAMVGHAVVGHNVKFDVRWTYAMSGVDLAPSIYWDTMGAEHLLDENTTTRLKERAPDRFGVQRWDDVDLKHPGAAEEEPLFKLGAYAARDTYWTWKLYENQRLRMFPAPGMEDVLEEQGIEEARLGQLAKWCVMPTFATLTAMEQRGLTLDTAWVQERIAENEAVAAETKAWLVGRYVRDDLPPEGASFAPTSIWFRTWTEASVENGDLRVAALTPNGKPQWSSAVLTRQARAGSEIAQNLLRYRKATKLLEFLRSWLAQVSREGTIHSTYNAGSVVTGRLSSSGPNMQQVTKALRPAFVPRPGRVIADLDYSQIELRVAAFISRSAPMIAAFQRGDDLHKLLASRITGKAPEDVTPKERQAGKSANFGLLYGMGASGFLEYAETVYGVHFTDQEAHAVHDAFFAMWDGIRQWHMRSTARVHEMGQVMSPVGRVRRLGDKVWDGNDKMVMFGERAAINSPVQGFASDIMQMAAASIEGNIPGVERVPGAYLVGTVHDSILVEVEASRWKAIVEECQRRMERTVPLILEGMGVEFDVPLVADYTVGTRWSLDDVSHPAE